jgi:SAM-dependent methyltransferase
LAISDEQRARTLERFAAHRHAWESNPFVRELYAEWYARVAAELPPVAMGPRVEIGSGPGFARSFIPDLELTDVVRAPWHDREVSADALPYADGSVGALVLFDVLHHLPSPRRFFAEATRVLHPSGRIVLCEPHMSALSYPVYKLFHEEPVALFVDPLADHAASLDARDPFDANQAIPSVLFGRKRKAFERAFPALLIRGVTHFSGLSYPASGGFSRGPLVPTPVWRALRAIEKRVPEPWARLTAFRSLVVIERT